jgi:hypothetical protein
MSPGGILPDGRRLQDKEVDVDKLQDQLDVLGESIKQVVADIQDARANGDVRKENALSGTLTNLQQAQRNTESRLEQVEREKDKGDPGKAFGGYLAAHLATQLTQAAVGAGNTIIGSQKTRASGDALGASIQQEKGIGQLVGGGAGTLLGALVGSLIAPGVGTLAGAGIGGSLGGFLGGIPGNMSEIDVTYSQQYKNALPVMESFYQRYGKNINTKSGAENRSEAIDWYDRAADMSMGTGKTTEDLMQAAVNRGAYGNFSANQTLTGARQDIMWERYTGANLQNIQKMSGLALRYDGDQNAVQTAYAGLTASGMGKGQFDEFLTDMQRIMEEGIENGFVRGADEIAGNMTLLSKLSGGSALWTGEQGANRLMKMNEAVSRSTDLTSVEDVISYSVARDLIGGDRDAFDRLTGGAKKGNYFTGTYVDEMQLLERGVSPELLKGQFESVRGLEGEGNTAGQIERFMKMYNLNYTGAAQVWAMSEGSSESGFDWNKATEGIKALQVDPQYKSDTQKVQDLLTKIEVNTAKIGSIKFEQAEIPRLTEEAGKVEAAATVAVEEARTGAQRAQAGDKLEELAGAAMPILGEDPFYRPTRNFDFQMNLGTVTRYKNKIRPLGIFGPDYGEEVAGRFNTVIGGMNDPSRADRATILAIEEFADKFFASRNFFADGINERERGELSVLLDRVENLVTALNRNTSATERDVDRDRGLTVTVE